MKLKTKPKILNERGEVGTLVCFALEQEAVPFRRLAVKMPDVKILITGIGARNAGTSVRRFLEQHLTKQVFTCGFCGGLNPDLENGDVVFMTGYPALEKRLAEADATLATFFSAPRIATTAAEKKQLRTKTGADVVEMESEAILEVCREKKIPCAMVRAISDTADEDLPLDFNALIPAGFEPSSRQTGMGDRQGTLEDYRVAAVAPKDEFCRSADGQHAGESHLVRWPVVTRGRNQGAP